jgi:ApaG protein
MPKPEFTVSVAVQPLAERTDPEQDRYAFAYTITIRNTGDVPAQLIARHWVITDARGHVEEVRGLAVVGHQPLLQPGEQFQYSSWAQISTPQGSMRGKFFCFTHDAYPFEAAVEEFGLTTSSSLH